MPLRIGAGTGAPLECANELLDVLRLCLTGEDLLGEAPSVRRDAEAQVLGKKLNQGYIREPHQNLG